MVEVSFTKGQVQSPIPQMGTEQMDGPAVDDCIQIGYLVIEPTVLFGVGLTGVGKEEARESQCLPPSLDRETHISERSFMPSIVPESPVYWVPAWRLW